MSKTRTILYSILGLFAFIAIIMLITTFSIGHKKIFGVWNEDVDRQIFEQTKSYTHGMTQDLAKYYGEWATADSDGKIAIEGVIKTMYADFDKDKVNSSQLRNFLTKARGY